MKKIWPLRLWKSLLQATLILLVFSDCKNEDENDSVTLLLRINHKVGAESLKPDSLKYRNASNQLFSVKRFNYYLSNIKLRNQETGDFYHEVDSYHLVQVLKNPDNTEIILRDIPKKKFSQLELSIGVDNGANHSTDQVGDLDPANFMAWDWTTGYKFMELSGDFKTDTAQGSYVFHIGEDLNYKTFTLSFAQLLGRNFEVVKDGQILVEANVAEVMEGPNPVDFNTIRSSMSTAEGSTKLADNYAEGFFKLVGAN